MKAVAAVPSKKKIEVVDHAPPKMAAESDVLVRVLEIGLCGTDKEIASFQYGTPPAGSEYLVIGHESLVEVVEAGPDAKLKSGQLAVMMVRRPCNRPECPACRMGRQDFCVTGQFTERGINGAHGYMTERVVDDAKYVVPLPAELRDVGVLTEPLTIAEKALLEVGDLQDRLPWVRPGKEQEDRAKLKAVVLGAGPVGLLGAMALAVRGFDVYVYSLERPPNAKSDFAEAIGATYVCAADGLDALTKATGNIDLVYEATGAASVAFQVLEVLGTNGMFILTGVPGRKGPIEIDADLIMRNLVLKNQLVYGTVNAGRNAFEAAVADLQEFRKRWPKQVSSLITGRFKPEEAPGLLAGKPQGIKNTIAFAGT